MSAKEENKFLEKVMGEMTGVLKGCNNRRDHCACIVQVKYVDDQTVPESSRYKRSDFYFKAVEVLEKANNPIDVLKK